MTTRNITWLQLPDGKHVGIEGGDAESTGRYILQNYLGQQPVSQSGQQEEPLELPPPMFSSPKDESSSALSSSLVGNDEVLEIPKMEFGAPEAPARSAFVANDEPLELPKMIF